MDNKCLESAREIHVLGVRYLSDFLHRAGFKIHEMNINPDHHFQLLAKINGRDMLIAVRTAYQPDAGVLLKTTKEQLIKEAEQLGAVPHFAGLSVTAPETNDINVGGRSEGRDYKFTFYGISLVSINQNYLQ